MEKRALVLSGGGARGAYELGVWKALLELDMSIDIVTGTSIGALNGALLAQQDFQLAEKVWLNIDPKQVILTDETDPQVVFRQFLKNAFTGGADMSPLESLLRSIVDETKVRQSPIRYGLVTVKYPFLKPIVVTIDEIPEGQLVDYLIASAAVYPVFRPKKIGEERFIDGGFYDNIPINLSLEMGATHILAVDLQTIGMIRKVKDKNAHIDVIRPSRDLGSFLLFDKNLVRRNEMIGYFDAMKFFNQLEGNYLTFKKGELRHCAHDVRKEFNRLVSLLFEGQPLDFFTLIRNLSAFRLFKGKHDDKRVTTSSSNINRAIDITAHIFELDDTHLFTYQQYRQHLKRAVQAVQKKELQQPRDPDTNIEQFRTWEKSHLTLYFYRKLKGLLENGSGRTILYSLSLVYSEYMLAAIYLVALQQATKRHQINQRSIKTHEATTNSGYRSRPCR